VLATVLRRDLRLEAISNAEASEELSKSFSPDIVDAFLPFFVDGEFDDSSVLTTVQEITGRPPRTFEQWAATHADAFR
jgi:hypothetical protein